MLTAILSFCSIQCYFLLWFVALLNRCERDVKLDVICEDNRWYLISGRWIYYFVEGSVTVCPNHWQPRTPYKARARVAEMVFFRQNHYLTYSHLKIKRMCLSEIWLNKYCITEIIWVAKQTECRWPDQMANYIQVFNCTALTRGRLEPPLDLPFDSRFRWDLKRRWYFSYWVLYRYADKFQLSDLPSGFVCARLYLLICCTRVFMMEKCSRRVALKWYTLSAWESFIHVDSRI